MRELILLTATSPSPLVRDEPRAKRQAQLVEAKILVLHVRKGLTRRPFRVDPKIHSCFSPVCSLFAVDPQLRADLLDSAGRTLRVSSHADLAPMMDEAVRKINPFLTRHELHQIQFNLFGSLGTGQAETTGDPEYVRVYHNAGGDSIGGAEDHIGGFASHPRQAQELIHGLWYYAMKLGHDFLSGCFDVSGFVPEEARGANHRLQLILRSVGEILCRRILLEESRSYLVDPDISALSREDGSH